MITRLTYLLLGTFFLASCKVEKEAELDAKDSGTVPDIGHASDFPSQNQITSQKVFSEDVLNSLGYITTEVADKYHAIRSTKNYGDANEAFYARFHLAKAEFENYADASKTKSHIEVLLKTDAGFKDYTQIIQQGDKLYSVSATSNYTFLYHQPKLMKMARIHLTKQAEQDEDPNHDAE